VNGGKPSLSGGFLPFQIDPTPIESAITSFSGLPLIAETFRSLGLDRSAKVNLPLKQRDRGFTEAQAELAPYSKSL
jgi:hypothetical protein